MISSDHVQLATQLIDHSAPAQPSFTGSQTQKPLFSRNAESEFANLLSRGLSNLAGSNDKATSGSSSLLSSLHRESFLPESSWHKIHHMLYTDLVRALSHQLSQFAEPNHYGTEVVRLISAWLGRSTCLDIFGSKTFWSTIHQLNPDSSPNVRADVYKVDLS